MVGSPPRPPPVGLPCAAVGLDSHQVGPRAHHRARVSGSLVDANPRRASPQQCAEHSTQKPTRPRRLTVIGRKRRPLTPPRIGVVAERPRPGRRNHSGRRGQGEQRTHPGSRRHVDVYQPADAREKSTVNNWRWKTHGIKRVDVLERRRSDRRSRVQREIRALRVSDNSNRPIGPRRRICQIVCGPPLRICRKIKAEAGILRPPDRACIRPAEDHVGRPGLVDEGDGTELSERA